VDKLRGKTIEQFEEGITPPEREVNTDLYKTVYTVVVLSDRDIRGMSLNDIAREVIHGDLSGTYEATSCDELTTGEMASELMKQGSDPEFLLGENWREDIGILYARHLEEIRQ